MSFNVVTDARGARACPLLQIDDLCQFSSRASHGSGGDSVADWEFGCVCEIGNAAGSLKEPHTEGVCIHPRRRADWHPGLATSLRLDETARQYRQEGADFHQHTCFHSTMLHVA